MARKRRPAGQTHSPRLISALICCCFLATLAGCASTSDSRPDEDAQRQAETSSWRTIQAGDTLGDIARQFDIPVERLQRFNPDVNPQRLLVGHQLLIPRQEERAPSAGPYRYQVRAGDTFAGIARHFGSRTQDLISANPGISPTALGIGQLIKVPVPGRPRRPPSASDTTTADRPPSSDKLPSSADDWPWPLDDYRIVRRFGPDERGTLQPMLLATQAGAQATAVASGDVRFAGSMRQLGQVVIIHHPDNLQSVYALCAALQVEEGTQVTSGDALCEVGQNGNGRYDLLFDLRQGGNPIDPRRVLR